MKKVKFIVVISVLLFAICGVLSACDWFDDGDNGTVDDDKEFEILYFDEATDTEKSLKVTQGSDYSLSSVPVRVGYKFLGLFDEDDKQFVNESGKSLDVFRESKDLSLNVKWERFLVTVKYNVGDAAIQNPADLKEQTFDFNGNITAVPTPLRTGWTFLGWFSNANGYTFSQYSDNLGMLADKAELNAQNYPSLKNGKVLTFFARFERIFYDVQIYYDHNLEKQLGTFKVAHGDTVSDYVKDLPTTERISRGVANRLEFYSEQGAATEFTLPVVKDTVLIGNWSALSGYDDYIVTKDDFFRIAQNKSDSYLLLNDLNLGTWNAPFDFAGTLNGGGNQISFTQKLEATVDYFGGLFTRLDSAVISDLRLNVNITRALDRSNTGMVGGLAGMARENTSISKVGITGSISIGNYSGYDYVGGIIGQFLGGSIDQSKNSATVYNRAMNARTGGIVGYANATDNAIVISNSYNEGNLLSTSNWTAAYGGRASGGIAAQIRTNAENRIDIINCYNNSDVVLQWTGVATGGWQGHGGVFGDLAGGSSGKVYVSNTYWNALKCPYSARNSSNPSNVTGINRAIHGKTNMTGFDYQGEGWGDGTVWVLSGNVPRLMWE